jgi:hypothetical protein
MKMKFSFLLFFVLAIFVMLSCNKEKKKEISRPGQVELAFSAKTLKSCLKSFNSDTITGLTWVVYSIEDASGNIIKNSEKVELYFINGDYISKPISLVDDSYKLTRVLLLDWRNKIVYASPVKGCSKASLVQVPLSIPFNVQNGKGIKLTPEVISSYGSISDDFGYITFGYEVSNTFDFLIGVFVYNDLVKNYELTSATITITSGATSIIPGVQLNAKQNDPLSFVSAYDSIGVTNKITLPSNYNNYTLVISKEGYTSFNQTFTKEQLKQHFRSVDKGPLVVILKKLNFANGLVAYYKFNGDVLDYSGNNNNGTSFGGVYASGRKSDINAALGLNGLSDYVVVKNATSLNPINGITVAAWVKSSDFVGCGNDAIVDKSYSSYYQYHLAMPGNYGTVSSYTFGFNVCINNGSEGVNSYPVQWIPNQWYHVVGTYDGLTLKLFVNGTMCKSQTIPGTISQFNTDLFIGKIGYTSYYTPVNVDEVRIYNRALSQEEITILYQQ